MCNVLIGSEVRRLHLLRTEIALQGKILSPNPIFAGKSWRSGAHISITAIPNCVPRYYNFSTPTFHASLLNCETAEMAPPTEKPKGTTICNVSWSRMGERANLRWPAIALQHHDCGTPASLSGCSFSVGTCANISSIQAANRNQRSRMTKPTRLQRLP